MCSERLSTVLSPSEIKPLGWQLYFGKKLQCRLPDGMDRIFFNGADQIGKDALALIDSGSCQACLSRFEIKQINQLQTVVSFWSFEEFIGSSLRKNYPYFFTKISSFR